MGIGIKNSDWLYIVNKARGEDKCICEQHENSHKFCVIHGFSRNNGHKFGGKITTTDEAESFIAAHRLKRGEDGKLLPSTERGRRRKEKRGK